MQYYAEGKTTNITPHVRFSLNLSIHAYSTTFVSALLPRSTEVLHSDKRKFTKSCMYIIVQELMLVWLPLLLYVDY